MFGGLDCTIVLYRVHIYASIKLHINIHVATSVSELILSPKMSTKYEHYFSFLNRAIVAALKQCDRVKYVSAFVLQLK